MEEKGVIGLKWLLVFHRNIVLFITFYVTLLQLVEEEPRHPHIGFCVLPLQSGPISTVDEYESGDFAGVGGRWDVVTWSASTKIIACTSWSCFGFVMSAGR